MVNAQRGLRGKLSTYVIVNEPFQIEMNTLGDAVYDHSCFAVDSGGRLSDERYMIFYNQTGSPNGEIEYTEYGKKALFTVNLDILPDKINKLVFTVSIDGKGTMGQIKAHEFKLIQGEGDAVLFCLNGQDFKQERAIITVEIYKKQEWRIAFVAQGFNGGLADLLHSYGGEAADDSAEGQLNGQAAAGVDEQVPQQSQALSQPSEKAEEAYKADTVSLSGINVMAVPISLASSVNSVINPPVEFWYYGARTVRMQTVQGNTAPDVPNGLGMGNNEPAVMKEIIDAFSHARDPVRVLFLSTGGIGRTKEILEMLRYSEKMPIFWKFIGVGGTGYGILNDICHISNNASFTRINRIQDYSSDMLSGYSRGGSISD